ncbi:hypothetical protein LC612_43770 [Nostoc sp. CHAB 5834]|nr:hypothetical protein [Nostoc sp. CHAB 5834]
MPGLSFSALNFHQGLFYAVLYGTNAQTGTGAFLYTSPDGKAWTKKGRIEWSAYSASGLAVSSTGRILVSGLSKGSTGGKVVVSDDGGATWVQTKSTGGLGTGIAVNDAGVAVFTTVNIPQGFRSTNNGSTWANNAVSDNSSGNKIVSDGGVQFATFSSGSLRYSTDSGANWGNVFAGGGELRDVMFVGTKAWFVGGGGPVAGRVCSIPLGGALDCELMAGSPMLTSLTQGNGTTVVGTATNNIAYKRSGGTSWTPITGLPAYPALVFGNGLFVGASGGDTYVAIEP